ncbi:3-oxoadipyl-CoA/3-oxo-5,6-dehydrosuberyl-CoA thiolase [Geodia barretti]|uniref:acetyl-CoA C-acetyltransferase n=1 Tax=Geodia barretti TaxID=519541 RepID=A0AA35X9Y0_GEOBA|nr:3-oxoadipyl-CoA/3-oxo-5,6-dehydrosuberyl-CoA thiolase [Geodia barretti]
MGIGPVPSVNKLMPKIGMSLEDMDLIELNEAFAAQVLSVLREWKLPNEDKLNVNGCRLEQGGWVPLDAFPTSEPDAQIRWQTDFHSNPNVRGLPEDYPVNEAETPISPLMYNAVGGSTHPLGAIASVEYDVSPTDYRRHLRSLASADIIYCPGPSAGARPPQDLPVTGNPGMTSRAATGALYYDANGNLQEQRARVVVVAGNGVGTARLLLNSIPSGQEFYETDLKRALFAGMTCRLRRYQFALPTALAASQQERALGTGHHRIFGERYGHTIGITVMTEDLPEESNQ